MAFLTPPPADFNVAFPGPPGPPGADGADGAQGPPGADGADGIDGADGADGASDWIDITGKPSTFPPDPEAVDDRVAALLVAGSNITLNYDDPANTLTIASIGGGGGTTILDGSGPPADALGSTGDYYVDEDGNQMYGPKAAPGATIDQTAIPPSAVPVSGFGGPQEVANHIKATAVGNIVAVRYWHDATTAQVAFTVKVWTTAGVLLSSGSTANDGGGSGWKQITLTTPVAMAVNDVVVASVGHTGVYARDDADPPPTSNGGDIVIVDGAYGYVGSFPAFIYGINWFVDVVFQVALPVWPTAVAGAAIGGEVASGTSGGVLFVDSGGNLAQDATFVWDNTLNDLHVGGAYYVSTARALYVVPGSPENNWFEGNAGNQTLTGYGNFGTGDLSLSSLTSGYQNVAVGTSALKSVTSGTLNMALGSGALEFITSDTFNTAIGPMALHTLSYLGTGAGGNTENVAVGSNSMANMYTGHNNVAIGASSGLNLSGTPYNNTIIGPFAGNNLGGGAGTAAVNDNTLLGANSGYNITGASKYNVWVGSFRGISAVYNNTITLSDGLGSNVLLDWGVTTNNKWSIANHPTYSGAGIHLYNSGYGGSLGAPTNYERGVVDWISNVFTIGTQATGTGTLRPVNIIGSALTFNGSPIGGGGGSMAIGGAITSATAGSVLFADVGGVLSQDNTNFYFDNTTNNLRLGGHFILNNYNNYFYIGTQLALLTVPHGTGANWFTAGGGNTTLTGHSNFGDGQNTLRFVTTGYENTAIGDNAMASLTTGIDNVAVGQGAMYSLVDGSDNFALGRNALSNNVHGSNNSASGTNALLSATGSNLVALGSNSARSLVSGNNNTFVGSLSGYQLPGGGNNTFIGYAAGFGLTSSPSNCTVIGPWQGPASVSLNNVIALATGNGGLGLLQADYNYINNQIWSFQNTTQSQGIHVYNTLDSVGTPVNYERAVFDWRVASNVLTIGTQAGGTGVKRLTAIDGFTKAGAPAASDLPAGCFALIDDTSGGQTWLVFNKAGTIRKVQLT